MIGDDPDTASYWQVEIPGQASDGVFLIQPADRDRRLAQDRTVPARRGLVGLHVRPQVGPGGSCPCAICSMFALSTAASTISAGVGTSGELSAAGIVGMM